MKQSFKILSTLLLSMATVIVLMQFHVFATETKSDDIGTETISGTETEDTEGGTELPEPEPVILSQTLTINAEGIVISWEKIEGAGHYKIYRDHELLANVTDASSYTDSNLTPAATYAYHVEAYAYQDNEISSLIGVSEEQNYMYLETPVLSSVSNDTSGATVKWGQVTGATGYIIYRRTTSGAWGRLATLPDGSTVSYTDKTAKSGTTYYYTVRALNDDYLSYHMSPGLKNLYLSTPSLSGVSNDTSGVTVKWGKVTGATGYIVYRRTTSGAWGRLATLSGGSTVSYTDKTAKSGTAYYYTVRALNGSYLSYHMSPGLKDIYLSTPSLSGVSNDTSGVTVKWGKVTGATGYIVYRRTTGGAWGRIATFSGGSTVSYTDKTAKSGTTYYYTVRASNGSYLSYHMSPGLKNLYLSTPSLSSVSNDTSGVTVKWGKVTGATGYIVYRRTTSGAWGRLATLSGGSTVSYTDKTAKSGTAYYYTVRALNGNSLSYHMSPGLKVTYFAAPTSLTAVMSGKTVKISWKQVSGAAGYRVYRKTSGGSWTRIADISSGSTVSYTDKAGTYGKSYTYCVRAYKKSGSANIWSGLSPTKTLTYQAAAPTLVSSVPASATSMKITWKQVTDADGYYVYRKTSSGWKRLKDITANTTTTYTDTGLTYGSSYTYTVKAYWLSGSTKQGGSYSSKGITAKLSYTSKYVNGYKLYYDHSGNLITDVEDIIGKQSSYVIMVNKQSNTVTVYAKDGSKGYTIPVKAFVCSCGNATPIGTFYTPVKYRWKILSHNVYGQWSTRITGGILFHSVWYYSQNKETLSVTQYNKLGTTASAGCVRLTCADAKWIYDNCALNTKVVIYNDSNPGPLGKPTALKLPSWHTWDPTDPTCADLCAKKGCH